MQHTPATDPGPLAGAPDRSSVAARMADAFGALTLRSRARMLGRLLASVSSFALAVVGGGAFAKYLGQAGLAEVRVSFEDAARATWEQVYDLVRYVQQSDPDALERVRDEFLQFASGAA